VIGVATGFAMTPPFLRAARLVIATGSRRFLATTVMVEVEMSATHWRDPFST
jgi:hypothetical protein